VSNLTRHKKSKENLCPILLDLKNSNKIFVPFDPLQKIQRKFVSNLTRHIKSKENLCPILLDLKNSKKIFVPSFPVSKNPKKIFIPSFSISKKSKENFLSHFARLKKFNKNFRPISSVPKNLSSFLRVPLLGIQARNGFVH
jgi:hypothetical protein